MALLNPGRCAFCGDPIGDHEAAEVVLLKRPRSFREKATELADPPGDWREAHAECMEMNSNWEMA